METLASSDNTGRWPRHFLVLVSLLYTSQLYIEYNLVFALTLIALVELAEPSGQSRQDTDLRQEDALSQDVAYI